MLNKVQIIGRLGRDVELRQTPSGQSVASFTVATDESYTARDGQKVEQTEWHRINVFGKQAELCGKFIGKGSLVYVEGRIRTRKWTDQSGQERSSTEINADRVQFLDRKQEQPQRQAQAPAKQDDWDQVPF
jgi:single-strand DNA-binding protein